MIFKLIASLFCVVALFAASTVYGQRKPKTQRVTVTLTESDGYKPDSFTLRRGVLAKLTFIRHGQGCGETLVIPAYGIRRHLPMDTPVTITIDPRRTGTFAFACGMNMYKGQIIVS
jgi:plastocyanin domain-containing protein